MSIEETRVGSAPISQREPRKSVLERLKHETAAEHATIENATAIMNPRLSLLEYRAYLESSLGFYCVAEAKLCRAGVWEVLNLPAAERLKLPLLVKDLQALGHEDPFSLPVCDQPPEWPSAAAAVGGAYVLEGSTLGGRVISRHIHERFGADAPCAFLECYGRNTGEKWQAFRSALAGFASSREIENQIIAGARATFTAFTRWLNQRAPAALCTK
jgi:heme oxygenase (biliverdin-IX-beta and delta-forming)